MHRTARTILAAAVMSCIAIAVAAQPALSPAGPQPISPPFAALDACPPNKAPPLILPRLKAALDANQEVVIVALGSSSTQGWRASDIAHSYPAVLQSTLSKAFPKAHIAVVNRGIGGQDVMEEVPRLAQEVVGFHPTLVIWQVGANGAMRRMEPALFERLVKTGVTLLQAADIGVVLMDNQRAPLILASPDHARIDDALADVSRTHGAGLFQRGALMQQWQASGYPYDEFISDDGVHHNDHGYRCIAEALARSMIDGLTTAPRAVATTR